MKDRGRRIVSVAPSETVIVVTTPDSRLGLVWATMAAAGNILVEGIKLGLITTSQALRAFVVIGEALISVVPTDRKSDS